LTYGYQYGYKKQQQALKLSYSTQALITIYHGYQDEADLQAFDFWDVMARYQGQDHAYIIRRVKLQDLVKIKVPDADPTRVYGPDARYGYRGYSGLRGRFSGGSCVLLASGRADLIYLVAHQGTYAYLCGLILVKKTGILPFTLSS
jgi:hypothetical protein